jgi:hypothetical protein
MAGAYAYGNVQWVDSSTYRQFGHWLGVELGNSGGCIYGDSLQCFGVQSEASSNYNIGRAWNSETYNFFATYFHWPG